ncbi:MAG TPA: cupredoxin domain-containing protein [Thermoanaerobaculia bacterium]|nr:cupredoxin domain-containing protein [Thermoanaerobaculia bacterium]
MKHNGIKHTGAALLCTALLTGVPFLTACGGDHSDAKQANQVIEVHVTDHQLEMPTSLPTGPTTFKVVNTGTHEHSFQITGPAGDQKLETALKPGETGSIELYLDTGTYRVFCPVDQNQGHSMQIALNVHNETGSTGG